MHQGWDKYLRQGATTLVMTFTVGLGPEYSDVQPVRISNILKGSPEASYAGVHQSAHHGAGCSQDLQVGLASFAVTRLGDELQRPGPYREVMPGWLESGSSSLATSSSVDVTMGALPEGRLIIEASEEGDTHAASRSCLG